MVLPITQVITEEGSYSSAVWWKRKIGWRQVKPYTLTLPFDYRRSFYTHSASGTVFSHPGFITDWMSSNMARPEVDNITYAKFISKMKSQSSELLTTLGEHKSARQMITRRSAQMLKLALALRKRRFKEAYRICRVDFPKKNVNHAKSFSNLWLEWSWGWSPMIGDIGDALETLVSPVLPIYVRASHGTEISWLAYSSTLGTQMPNSIRDAKESWNMTYRCSTGAAISVSNPNTALLNRLGLLDLAGTVWAVTAFSFIIDKYINIGQMLSSLTDTYGFTLTQPWTNRRMDIKTSGTDYMLNQVSPGTWEYAWNRVSVGDSTVKIRTEGLLGPTLSLRSPSIGSFSEGASYIALLIQLLSKK